ncbi:MAG: hypothetical protein WDW36_008332 [Sanguina aurantia]
METAIQFNDDKQMMLKVHQRFTTRPQLELKGDAWFNTVTGSLTYKASLKKYVSLSARTKDAGSTPLRIGLGLVTSSAHQATASSPSTSSSSSIPNHFSTLFPGVKEPLLHVCADKAIALLDGPNTLLEAAMVRQGTAVISHKFLNLTRRQDLKLSVGLDVDWPQTGAGQRSAVAHSNRNHSARASALAAALKPSLFVEVRENNWAAQYKHERFSVTYDL